MFRPIKPIDSTAGAHPSSTVDARELTARITLSSTTCTYTFPVVVMLAWRRRSLRVLERPVV